MLVDQPAYGQALRAVALAAHDLKPSRLADHVGKHGWAIKWEDHSAFIKWEQQQNYNGLAPNARSFVEVVETPLNVREAWPSVSATGTADTFLKNASCERMPTIALLLAPAVLTFILGMFAATTTEPLRRWLLRPRLKIRFDNLAACNAKLGEG